MNHFHDAGGDADGARVIGEKTADILPDPPGSVGTELEAAAMFKFLNGPHEAQIALLN